MQDPMHACLHLLEGFAQVLVISAQTCHMHRGSTIQSYCIRLWFAALQQRFIAVLLQFSALNWDGVLGRPFCPWVNGAMRVKEGGRCGWQYCLSLLVPLPSSQDEDGPPQPHREVMQCF